MPRRSRRLNPPCLLDGLSDDLVLRLLARAPFVTHGTLHVVCRRLKTLLRSDAFREQRIEYGLAEHGIICAGGPRGGRQIADGICSHGKLLPIPPMSVNRHGACSVIIDNEMWVMGGYDDDEDGLTTVEVYSPKTNSWRSCAPMNQRRWDAVAGVVGGRLVVAGGYCGDDGEEITSAEAYTGTEWTALPPMPHEAWIATACVLNGRLHVMGGWRSNKHQVLEMTEENGLAWTVKADLPATRHSAASVVHQGKIWVMGGNVDGEPSASVLTYNTEADAWETGPPLPSPQEFCTTAIAHSNGILVFGIGKTSGYVDSEWTEVDASFPRYCGAVFLG